MLRVALIMDGEVETVALWDGLSPWLPAGGMVAVVLGDGEPCGPGWSHDQDAEPRFSPPEEPA